MSALFGLDPRQPMPTFMLDDLIDRQRRWSAKGGRGRKKPKSLVTTFLFSGRKRGRPKQVKRKSPTYKYGNRYASRWHHADRTIIGALIAIAPEQPEKHIRTLVSELVSESSAYDERDYGGHHKSKYVPHVNRIVQKIDKQIPILRWPHQNYVIETLKNKPSNLSEQNINDRCVK